MRHRVLMIARGSPGLGHVMPLRRAWKAMLPENSSDHIMFATYGSGAVFMASAGDPILTIPEPASPTGYSFESGECLDKLGPVLSDFRPDILVGAGEPSLGFLGEQYSLPVILVVNPIDFLIDGPNRSRVLARHAAYRRCVTLVAPSWPDERSLPCHGLPARWIDLIPSDPIKELPESGELRRTLGLPPDVRIVVCSPGGGSGVSGSQLHDDSLALVHCFRRSLCALSSHRDELLGLLVASGDFDLDEAAIRPLQLVKNAPSLLRLFAACDVAVARAGRQTVFELMALGKPALAVVPGDETRSFEQRSNAERVSRTQIGRALLGVYDADKMARSLDDLLRVAESNATTASAEMDGTSDLVGSIRDSLDTPQPTSLTGGSQ